MQIVSGIATASGVSPLLNAPRDASTDTRANTGEAARAEVVRRKELDQRLVTRRETARPVDGPEPLDRADRAPDRLPARTSTEADQRRERFVESLNVIRRDAGSEPVEITTQRLRQIRELANVTPEVLEVARADDRPDPELPLERASRARPPDPDRLADTFTDDGVPTPVEPVPPRVTETPETSLPSLAEDGIPAELEPIAADPPEETVDPEPSLADDGIPASVEPADTSDSAATGADDAAVAEDDAASPPLAAEKFASDSADTGEDAAGEPLAAEKFASDSGDASAADNPEAETA